MALEPRRAIRTALASYFTAELEERYPSAVKVYDQWPDGQPLEAIALSISVPPAPPEVREFQPQVISFAPGPTDPISTLQYSYGIATIGMQLDLWTGYPAVRDELVGVITELCNRPPAATLGVPSLPQLSLAPGLVLRIPDFYDGLCNFDFTHFPRLPEDSESAQTGKWRASWSGSAELHLLKEEAVAVLRQVQLQLKLNGGLAVTTNIIP